MYTLQEPRVDWKDAWCTAAHVSDGVFALCHITIKATNTVSWCRIDNADDWTDFIRLPLLGLLISEKSHGLSALDSPEDGRNDVSYYACLKSYQGSVFVFDVADDGLLLQRVAQIPFDLDYDYLSEDPGPVPSKGRCVSCLHPHALLNGG